MGQYTRHEELLTKGVDICQIEDHLIWEILEFNLRNSFALDFHFLGSVFLSSGFDWGLSLAVDFVGGGEMLVDNFAVSKLLEELCVIVII